MNTRIEKNRHHLATFGSILLGLPLAIMVTCLGRRDPWEFLPLPVLLFGIILILRTIVIESGVRRKLNSWEVALEAKATRTLKENFGIERIATSGEPLQELPKHEPKRAEHESP
jgi:hypothetical protein